MVVTMVSENDLTTERDEWAGGGIAHCGRWWENIVTEASTDEQQWKNKVNEKEKEEEMIRCMHDSFDWIPWTKNRGWDYVLNDGQAAKKDETRTDGC